MQVVRKKYSLIGRHSYGLLLKINDKRNEFIQFNGGSRATKKTGFYITEDPEIQAALEKDSRFKVMYFVEEEVKVKVQGAYNVPETRVIDEAEAETEAEAPAEEATEGEPADEEREETPEEQVTNVSKAHLYLVEKFPEDSSLLSKMKSKKELLAYAKEKGVVFPNWE